MSVYENTASLKGQADAPFQMTTDDGRVLLGCQGLAIENDGKLIWIACMVGNTGLYAPFTPDEAREAATALLEQASEVEAANCRRYENFRAATLDAPQSFE